MRNNVAIPAIELLSGSWKKHSPVASIAPVHRTVTVKTNQNYPCNQAPLLPQSPVTVETTTGNITSIPMDAARLRISSFPLIKN